MRKFQLLELLVTVIAIWVMSASALASPTRRAGTPPREVLVALNNATKNPSLAPLADGQATSSHAPYLMGECKVCHARNNKTDPGPVTRSSAALCLDCHDQVTEMSSHRSTARSCTGCHNPHNARWKTLLR